ncbi:hypothetical protein CLAIMM_13634 [Cladophialophora immunda]|nr:hypothetical protein CLAIMM_13634 [Cladophialophora immunda]
MLLLLCHSDHAKGKIERLHYGVKDSPPAEEFHSTAEVYSSEPMGLAVQEGTGNISEVSIEDFRQQIRANLSKRKSSPSCFDDQAIGRNLQAVSDMTFQICIEACSCSTWNGW